MTQNTPSNPTVPIMFTAQTHTLYLDVLIWNTEVSPSVVLQSFMGKPHVLFIEAEKEVSEMWVCLCGV